MTQRDLNRAVAAATGETVSEINHLGFSLPATAKRKAPAAVHRRGATEAGCLRVSRHDHGVWTVASTQVVVHPGPRGDDAEAAMLQRFALSYGVVAWPAWRVAAQDTRCFLASRPNPNRPSRPKT